jgi:hypothetical protein
LWRYVLFYSWPGKKASSRSGDSNAGNILGRYISSPQLLPEWLEITVKKLYTFFLMTKNTFNVILRIAKNSFLLFVFKKKLSSTLEIVPDLQLQNTAIQQELAGIFSSYSTCIDCICHCCHSKINRFDIVDCYVYGLQLDYGLSPWHTFKHLLDPIFDMLRSRLNGGASSMQNENCEYFAASSGCSLPFGQRPSMCVAGACYNLLISLSGDDAKKYSSMLTKYILFHNRCFWLLATKLINSSH